MFRALILACGLVFSVASWAVDEGWQWYHEPLPDETAEPVPAPPAPPDILDQVKTLQTATKRAMYEAILHPGVENFTRYFQLQNYWTQQAGLFSMSAKAAMLAHPEQDYNLQHSHYNGTVKNQLAMEAADQAGAIKSLSARYGILLFYRGRNTIDGQLAEVVSHFRETYHLSVIPVTLDGVVSPALPDSRHDQGQAKQLGVRYFPALVLVDPKAGSVRPLSYGFISQDDLAKQFLYVSTDFRPTF